MSIGETRTDSSLSRNDARSEREGEKIAVSNTNGVNDIVAILEALTDTGNPSSLPKSSITDDSLRELSRYLMEHDPSSQLFVPLAEELCSRELWQEAAETCRRGLAFHPRQFRVRVLLGWALWELGKTDEAESLLAEARKELENSAVIYKILARAAENRGNSAQAWRLMHIYQSLHDKEEWQAAEEVKTSAGLPPDLPESRDLYLIRFLSTLLEKYEGKKANAIPEIHIFSDADCRVLGEIIDASKP